MKTRGAQEHLSKEDRCVAQLLAIVKIWPVYLCQGDKREYHQTNRQISKGQAHYQSIGGGTEFLINNNC